MATPILTQLKDLINLGFTVEQAVLTVVPGADVSFWQRVIANEAAKQTNPKKTKKQTKRSGSRKPSKRSSYASMQSALAWSTVELIERVNGGTL